MATSSSSSIADGSIPRNSSVARAAPDERVELEGGQGAGLGERVQPELRAGDDGQRALRAADQAREVERLGVDEGVQPVARDATDHAREPAPDLIPVPVPDLHRTPQKPRRSIRVTCAPPGFVPAERPEVHRLAGGQHAAQAEYLVRGHPVDEAAHAGRVVPDHAPERGHVGGRSVGPEHEPVRLDHGVELALHQPRLDDATPPFEVYLQRPAHLGDVEGEPRGGRLTGEARTRAAGGDGEPQLAGHGEAELHVLLRSGRPRRQRACGGRWRRRWTTGRARRRPCAGNPLVDRQGQRAVACVSFWFVRHGPVNFTSPGCDGANQGVIPSLAERDHLWTPGTR